MKMLTMHRAASTAQAQHDLIRHRAEGRIQYAATIPLSDAMTWVGSNLGGLDRDEVAHSEADNGRNVVTRGKNKSLARRLADAFVNPFTAILFFLAIISAATDMVFPALSLMGSVPEDFDPLTVIIITTMVVLSGTLRYIQEARSGNAAEKLLDMITTTVTVTRKGAPKEEIPIDDVVVGDIVHLSAGDMIPADVRIIEAKDLFVSQASLTGESEPVEKMPTTCVESDSATSFENIALMGSSVISGSATAAVFSVGEQTLFGSMASSLSDDAVETSFSKGVNGVSWVLIRFILAIIKCTEEEEQNDPSLTDLSETYVKVDEVPFDFARRRLTTVVRDCSGKTQMVTKGAVEEMLSVCSHAEIDGAVRVLDGKVRERILATVADLNDDGFRVLAIAQKSNPSPVGAFSAQDECDMVLIGYLAFLDPPKESTADAIEALRNHGVATKILTGDNEKVTRTICKQVGLQVNNMLLGSDIAAMDDAELARRAEDVQVFAKLTPDQKARVVSVLRDNGHVVGYMGDGINDASAMKSSDIGISVDTAVDVAKESADIILLEKDLMVLEEGIIEGRKTYANMIKYIKMTASSNFGNMFSVLAASALLPFLPMMSIQLILPNLIYDCSCLAIPWDNVDEEFLRVPRTWDASSVGRFMIWIGPTSSIFDFMTYIFMYFVFCPLFVSHGVLFNDLAHVYSGAALEQMQLAYIALFQAGWFVESMWSQTLVIHMIRTPKLPFIQSHASAPVMLLTMTGIALLTVIPFSPLGPTLGLGALPVEYFLFLIPCILLYMALATSLKKAYVRRYGELL